MVEFSEILKDLMIKRNMSQPDLAEILGVSRVSISKYQNGEAFPSRQVLIKIADLFNVTIDYLYGRENAEKYYFDKTKVKSEEEASIEQFLKETEAMIRAKGSISDEQLGHVREFMGYVFSKDAENKKNDK
ncbi:helix-turn-helix domain-containing protein [Paenibacillus sp. EPM92]|uniref:helix-turn-helix domain-containing protein n=1 Tax=Paenibacillus sp. EPM92 TaxID=1561195 RepID=UPI001915FE18|nr:helix-turn-helix transcriptional regulator [Paenibacillus sp. EPM92]